MTATPDEVEPPPKYSRIRVSKVDDTACGRIVLDRIPIGAGAKYFFVCTKCLEMDAKEIERAVSVAEEWEKTHPPLSYFVPVYGF